jgi:uncharacterized protein YdaU (DUF1376 family)
MREHEEDVMTVLNEFFISTEDGFVSPRADKEIKQYKEFAEAGKRGAAKRWGTPPNGEAISPPNAAPIATTNHKPITNNQIKEKATSVAPPEGVSDSVWQEFKSLRKAKKAPITQRAIDAITSEANKAGWTLEKALEECVVRGWQAFKADWVATKANPADIVRLTVASSNEPDPALEKIKADEKTTRPPTPEERAILNSYRRKA